MSRGPERSHGPILYTKDQRIVLNNTAVLTVEEHCARKRCYKLDLLSIIMRNVRILMMVQLAALTWLQRKYWKCSIMLIMETWLTSDDVSRQDKGEL